MVSPTAQPEKFTALDRTAKIAVVSILVAVTVMGIKYLAYLKTGSVALYSDALESIVNVITAVAALVAVRISAQPPDKSHPYGHHKVEYFSAVLEGALIIVAALLIIREAWSALLMPRTIEAPALGLAINGVATALNAGLVMVPDHAGRTWRSPALVADGWHLFTDVATSLGVIVGLALAAITGWPILDPLLAAGVAFHILHAGFKLTRESVSSLMDEAAPPEIQARIRETIQANGGGALQVHDVRTRHAGPATFIDFHLVVPGTMLVSESHQICDRLEDAIRQSIEGAQVTIHVEPEFKAKTKGAVDL